MNSASIQFSVKSMPKLRIALIASLAIVLAISTISFANSNDSNQLLSDAQQRFETTNMGWTAQGNTKVYQEPLAGIEGSGALLIQVDQSGPWPDKSKTARVGTPQWTSGVKAKTNTKYEGSVSIRGFHGAKGNARCEIREYNNRTIVATHTSVDVVALGSEWTQLNCLAETSSRARNVALRIFIADVEEGDIYLADNASLRIADIASEEPTPTQPPVTQPPATNPPETNPPATQPPATNPPTTEAPTPEQPNTSGRGPTGRWPSHTPAYTTPADVVVTSFGALQKEIDNGFAGKVIEANIAPTSAQKIHGGNTSWNKNILVRPPIGQRGKKFVITGGQNYLEASHVTFAGLTMQGGAYTLNQGRSRTVYAWTEMTGHPFIAVHDHPNFEWWEASHTAPTFAKSSADVMHVAATKPGQVVGAYLNGVYFNGAPIHLNGFDYHVDVFQTFVRAGGKINEITIANSVMTAADDKSLQLEGLSEDFTIDNSYISGPGSARSNWSKEKWYPWANYRLGLYNYAITGAPETISIRNSSIAGDFNQGPANQYGGYKEVANSILKTKPRADRFTNNVVDFNFNGPPPTRPTHETLDRIWSP